MAISAALVSVCVAFVLNFLSIVAARTHRVLGNIDLKLAGFMVIGTIAGSETGVQTIEVLKKGPNEFIKV